MYKAGLFIALIMMIAFCVLKSNGTLTKFHEMAHAREILKTGAKPENVKICLFSKKKKENGTYKGVQIVYMQKEEKWHAVGCTVEKNNYSLYSDKQVRKIAAAGMWVSLISALLGMAFPVLLMAFCTFAVHGELMVLLWNVAMAVAMGVLITWTYFNSSDGKIWRGIYKPEDVIIRWEELF